MYRYMLLLSFSFFAGCIAYSDPGYYRHHPYPDPYYRYYDRYYDYYGSGYYRYDRSHDRDWRERREHDGRGDRDDRGDRGDREGRGDSDRHEGRGERGHR